ncbi:MAG: dihydrofolate reductase [Flavobacteriia bacterium]|nr:dihydrofolate reductase [Flavobacteriia bacterium]OIP45724.1 MAG: diacylglycerol kinase [Flavobacteriaceae bacterium CG2_30_31_66]PIV97159.1 MAG: diacylglycerol kinase [Flavobacteriaceae bacterium CG17_big_fil_post_rev_8_21_14_2_50_31_13]PIX13618.1 MAG: diacylglycerol kinase [Flavobacteriaceae bacterium CG_4_8_14_3_um_filter_31_8]PIY14878.1 MAG: diacylglycerol kinase [Flavobacteriaceae bacterium CG_4_10_14_3_um_filter_31_253]PIZ09605.1 MAG: diacylglycerol kinase [Flavobacteriaceae bacterium
MITIIAAISKNNALGKNNDLIWHLPADLKRFKELTTGHHIIMGRKTYESIGKTLPNRITIIVSTDKNFLKEDCFTTNNLEDAIKISPSNEEVFIVGGAQIYNYAIENNLVDSLDITLVHHEFEADVYFPKIDLDIWEEVKRTDFKADEKNKFDYSFIKYMKIAS